MKNDTFYRVQIAKLRRIAQIIPNIHNIIFEPQRLGLEHLPRAGQYAFRVGVFKHKRSMLVCEFECPQPLELGHWYWISVDLSYIDLRSLGLEDLSEEAQEE